MQTFKFLQFLRLSNRTCRLIAGIVIASALIIIGIFMLQNRWSLTQFDKNRNKYWIILNYRMTICPIPPQNNILGAFLWYSFDILLKTRGGGVMNGSALGSSLGMSTLNHSLECCFIQKIFILASSINLGPFTKFICELRCFFMFKKNTRKHAIY